MTTISASWDTLLTQAGDTVETYLRRAHIMLDERFGDGYAEKNPQLVGQLVGSMTRDFQSASFGKIVGELADVIRDKSFVD